MADRMGSYHGAFYLAGCTVILGAAIPFILFFVKSPIARHEDQGQIANHNIQGSDFSCRNNLAHFEELGANHGAEAHTDAPCFDVKSGMIDMPLAGLNDTVLLCTEEGSSSGSVKPAENNNTVPLLLDAERGTSETFSRDDELMSNDAKTPETFQANAYQVEVQVNSPLASKSNVDNKQETTEQIVHNTKF